MQPAFNPEEVVQAAAAAVATQMASPELLDELPGPVYVTDTEGLITSFNKACIGFAGRLPAIKIDRWCVTWRLSREDGSQLRHDRCPMAVAIRERRAVRGTTAIAQRQDGTRASFVPYPTPVFDSAGEFLGAVNFLRDITGLPARERWLQEAHRCRRLLLSVTDSQTVEALQTLAMEYEEKARQSALGPR